MFFSTSSSTRDVRTKLRFQPSAFPPELLETRALLAAATANAIGNISGLVFQDLNNNGAVDAGEAVSGVPVNVFFRTTATSAENPVAVGTDVTDAAGFYSINPPAGSPVSTNVNTTGVPIFAQGFYRVAITPPVGLDSLAPEVNFTPNPELTVVPNQVINICAGPTTGRADPLVVDFPLVVTGDTQNASLSGFKYFDVNFNNTFDNADYGLANIPIILNGTSDAGDVIQRQTVTDADGFYEFANLPGGSYSIREDRPRLFLPGSAQAGSLGGQVVVFPSAGGKINNGISNISVNAGEQGTNYNITNRVRPECKLYCLSNRARSIQLLQTRRDLDPARFDANHPVVGNFLANSRNLIPPSLLRARGPLINFYVPTLVSRAVN